MPEGADIFKSEMQALMCPVNTFGAMGKGLALYFKQRYPELLEPYRQACWDGHFAEEGYFVFKAKDRLIVCLPTKFHWSRPSKIEWIAKALQMFRDSGHEHGITSLAVPALGCGEGGLAWESVRALIEELLGALPIPVEVYPP